MPNFNVLNGILFNKTNKIKQKKQQKLQQQPIKLQIELPFNQFFNSNDEDGGYNVSCNNKTLDLTTMTKRSQNVNHISLHISFDGGSKMSICENNNAKRVTRKSIKVQNGSTTSGYSSSIAEIICTGGDDSCSERGDIFSKNESISQKNEIKEVVEEHIYDKLNYINSNSKESKKLKSKRKNSLSSSSNSSSGSSLATSSSSSYYHLSKNDDYEEICNFSQVTSTPARTNNNKPPLLLDNSINETYTYETLYNCKSSSIKRIRKINKKYIQIEEDSFEHTTATNGSFNSTIINNNNNNKYKREYSVNEIFQNLEVFKKQAKEEEEEDCLHNNFQIPKPPKRHIYVNDRISKL